MYSLNGHQDSELETKQFLVDLSHFNHEDSLVANMCNHEAGGINSVPESDNGSSCIESWFKSIINGSSQRFQLLLSSFPNMLQQIHFLSKPFMSWCHSCHVSSVQE
jgi:hypothetical protein